MRKYGIKGLSLGDQRDVAYSYQARLNDPDDHEFQTVEAVPNVTSLICQPVADQADLGSCGPFSGVYHYNATRVKNGQEPINFSQLFLYYAYRELYGAVNRDDGVMLRDLLKTLLNVGVCREETWPYTLANWNKKPPPEAYEEAAQYRIKSYHSITSKAEMIQCLASRYGFLGGIGCYDSFGSPYTEKTGIVEIPGPGEKLLGWHALFFGAGYDLHKDVIKLQNSYGRSWGAAGFGTIGFDYLTNPRLASDFYSIRA